MALLIASGDGFDRLELQLRWETGDAYLGTGMLEQAEGEYRAALEMDDRCAEAWLGLGRIYSRREAWDASENYLTRYLELRPGDCAGLSELAAVMLRTSRPSEAALTATAAAEASSGDPGAWLLAAEACLASGDTAQSVRSLNMASLAGGEAAMESATRMAAIDIARGSEDEARRLLEPCAAAGYAPACLRLAELYLSWGDYLRAFEQASACLRLDPSGECSDQASLLLDSLSSAEGFMPPGEDI